MIQWTLGYVYDELQLYPLAIRSNQEAVAIDERFAPWAYWHIAISELNAGHNDKCIQNLEAVRPGPWWYEIYVDPELEPLKHGEYEDQFLHLYVERKSPYA